MDGLDTEAGEFGIAGHAGHEGGPDDRAGLLQIDCATCPVRAVACDDCVVSVLLGPAEFDHEASAALVVLADHGLVPPLQDPRRHVG